MRTILCSALALTLAPCALAQVPDLQTPDFQALDSQVQRLRQIAERAAEDPANRQVLCDLATTLAEVRDPESDIMSQLDRLRDRVEEYGPEFDRLRDTSPEILRTREDQDRD